jgi:hypothetical protein
MLPKIPPGQRCSICSIAILPADGRFCVIFDWPKARAGEGTGLAFSCWTREATMARAEKNQPLNASCVGQIRAT